MKYLGVPQSGSQANTTASRNRYGQYYRNRSIPVNPSTGVQTSNRALFGTASAAWRALSAVQRTSWISYAATQPRLDPLGQTIYWSGFQTFVECYMLRVGILRTPPTIPPSDPDIPQLTFTATADNSANSLSIAFDPDPVPADYAFQWDATANYSPGVFFAGPSDYRRVLSIFATDISPQVATAGYLAAWGAIGDVGNVIFVRGRVVAYEGCAGPWTTQRVAIVA